MPKARSLKNSSSRAKGWVSLLPSRWSMLFLASLFIFLGIGWGMKQAPQWAARTFQLLANKGYLRLEKLRIEGRRYTSAEDIRKALGISKGQPLFHMDVWSMRQRLLELPWIKAVTIQRQLPDLLWVRLVEQYPIAHWQHRQQLALIDDEGHVIKDTNHTDIGDLLIVTGEEAPRATPQLMAALRAYPQLKQRVTGAMYIGNRRWDIILDTKLRVKLPESNLEQGLALFKQLEENYVLPLHAILYVDVRNLEKAYIRYRPSFKPVSSSKSSKQA